MGVQKEIWHSRQNMDLQKQAEDETKSHHLDKVLVITAEKVTRKNIILKLFSVIYRYPRNDVIVFGIPPSLVNIFYFKYSFFKINFININNYWP